MGWRDWRGWDRLDDLDARLALRRREWTETSIARLRWRIRTIRREYRA